MTATVRQESPRPYKMTLTTSQMDALGWHASRYTAASLLYEALTPESDDDSDPVTYGISESDAWVVYAANEAEGFPCLNWSSNLGQKIRAFLDSIV